MKRIEYWLDKPIRGKPWATFHLVPVQTIHDTNICFNEIVELVKNAGFNYRIIETKEELIAHKGG